MLRHGACQFVKRKGREQIVVIDAGDEIACRQRERAVGVFGDAEIFRQELDAQPRLLSLPFLQALDRRHLGRAAIDRADFEIVVGLGRERREQFIEKSARRVVCRQEQTDLWLNR